MRVNRITPAGATFDITGLTEDEYRVIRSALICCEGRYQGVYGWEGFTHVLARLPQVEELSRRAADRDGR